MKPVRFLMIGGFLGAGKTTAIARLARHYTEQGMRVGLVTNDQAYDLVDTQSLRSQGFDVGEVPGACFCCKFNDLVETAEALGQDSAPDVIIAEPVGSCTDLAATVVEPLRQLYGDRYQPGPLAVLLKPEHGRKILRNDRQVGFSPKAAYIFLKQIEEADIVVVNKIDKLAEEEQQELISLVSERYPDKRVLAASSRAGTGFDRLIDELSAETAAAARFMEVDYQTYAEGEAELGWLNCQARVQAGSDERFGLDEFVLGLVRQLRTGLAEADYEPAHLKVMGQSGPETAVANLVDSEDDAELSLASEIQTTAADVIVNARVAGDPERLERIVRDAVARQASGGGLTAEIHGMQRFRPSPPVPTHRAGNES